MTASAADPIAKKVSEVGVNAISQAAAEAREEQQRQYAAALDVARRELVEQVQARLDQAIAALQDEPIRVRSMLLMLVSIAAAAVVISITALIVALAT